MKGRYALWGVVLVFGASLMVRGAPSWATSIPKDGRVAVVLVGSEALKRGDLTAAKAAIIRRLAQDGYAVVDKDRLDDMEQSEAARLALDGDVDAIMALGRKYGVQYYVKGTAAGHPPVPNEFGLYTATITIALQAYRARNGRYLFSDAVVGKEVGYTPQEASAKALLNAADRVAAALSRGEASSSQGKSSSEHSYSLFISGLSGLVAAEETRQNLENLPGVRSASLISAGPPVSMEVVFSGDAKALAEAICSSLGATAARVDAIRSLRVDF